MPKLVKLYIIEAIIGFVLSAAFVAVLLWQNVANLGHLVAGSDMGWIAVVMLFIGNGVVFAGVQFSMTVMRMAERPDPPAGGRKDPIAVPALVPVPVESGREN